MKLELTKEELGGLLQIINQTTFRGEGIEIMYALKQKVLKALKSGKNGNKANTNQ